MHRPTRITPVYQSISKKSLIGGEAEEVWYNMSHKSCHNFAPIARTKANNTCRELCSNLDAPELCFFVSVYVCVCVWCVCYGKLGSIHGHTTDGLLCSFLSIINA